ncbi:alpha/beta hydrolase [Paracoccus sphaerophysae]|uniref:alpha/beta hydrolase n=1 Tax=Paracoccus sphaerophysae TaxID=690417 RepID=UPI002352DAD8|nr:alpha/beta-hydrolase family protein [Paracoccus sphaerophysae]
MRLPHIPLLPLLLAVALFALSLTPSLVPRGWLLQGALGGLVAALGYMSGRFLLMLWRQMYLPMLGGRAALIGHLLTAAPVSVLLGWCLVHSAGWQNDIRLRMGGDAVDETRMIAMLGVAVALFIVLLALGFGVRWMFDRMRHWLARFMPQRTAGVLGLLLTVIALVILTRDGVLDRVIAGLDASYASAQQLFDMTPERPDADRIGGRPAEQIAWDTLGQPGRDFLTNGPDAQDIAAFTGRPAMDPIRVYVGLMQEETPELRARRALDELVAAGGFDRSVLIVAMPTGTGWLDPGSHDVVEYMHGGDIATVAVQYSYLQSPLALVLETDAGLAQAQSLIHTILAHWRSLPPDRRPRLFIHGLSLGAWASMYGTDLFALLDQPIDGALWAGPPFPSSLYNSVRASRNPGSPFVAPEIGTGRLIRFANGEQHGGGPEGWGHPRLMFLQYTSDPISLYDPLSLWREPVWMREPRAPDVSPHFRFIPIVTQFQLVVDMVLANFAPPGHGHAYVAADYIGPWHAVTAPAGWTEEDNRRLAGHCDLGFQHGCRNR